MALGELERIAGDGGDGGDVVLAAQEAEDQAEVRTFTEQSARNLKCRK